MDEIKQWLNSGQDYQTGCALVIKYSPNKALHQVFREDATPYKVARLKRELMALVVVQKTAAATQVATEVAHTIRVVEVVKQNAQPINRWGAPEQMPPVVHALWLEFKPLYAERNNVMARLHDVAKAGETDPGQKEEAGRMAHRILDLDDQIETIYQKRTHYITTGGLPVDETAPDDVVVDPNKIPVALQNAKRYVREFRSKLAKAPHNAAFASKLEHWQKRVDHYQNKLNG